MTADIPRDRTGTEGAAWRSPEIGYDPTRSRLHVTRRLGTTVSIIGIGSAQLAAHLGVYDAPNLRAYELFGVISLIWLAVFWWLPWPQGTDHAPAVMSLSCLGLVLGTVALTGAGDSLAWIYAMPLALYNSLYFRPKVAVSLLPLFMATGMIPAAATQDWNALRDQAFIVAPVYVIVTLIGIAVVPELRGTAEARLQSALALQRAADAESWTKRLESVQDVVWEAHQSSSVEQVCAAMMRQIRRAVTYDSCVVHLLQSGTLETIINESEVIGAGQEAPQPQLEADQDVAAWVAREGQPLLLDDRRFAEQGPRIRSTAGEPESVLAVPLTGHGQVVGTITVTKSGAGQFSADDLKAMMILGDHAGTAISNAQLLASARRDAETDGLTGLLNQHASRLRLASMLQDRVGGEQLSILLIDLNDFKPVNDALGHLAGDSMLRRVAEILATSCRKGDTVARCGGDEFMLILPAVGRADAETIGISIKQKAAAEGADLGIANPIPISLSFGVATAPEDGQTVTELLETADVHLYTHKRERGLPRSTERTDVLTSVAVAAE